MADEPLRAARLERGSAKQRARLERRPVQRQLDQRRSRCAGARSGEIRSRSRRCARTAAGAWRRRRPRPPPSGLARHRREVDPDRSADVEAANRLGGRPAPAIASSPGGIAPSTSTRVIAGVKKIPRLPPEKSTRPLRASSIRSFQPASASSSRSGGHRQRLHRSGRPKPLGKRAWSRRVARRLGERALPRLGAGNGRASHFDVQDGAFGDFARHVREQVIGHVLVARATPFRPGFRCRPAAPRGSCPRGSCRRARSALRYPAVVDERRPGLADPVLDQPFRQSDSPPL
jgi:hypothetical protein